jgi:MFS family permease
LRRGGGGRRDRQRFPVEATAMIVLAVLASLAAIGALCWLLFALAVYALPFFMGVTAGIWAYGTGAGWLGGIIVGFAGAAATFLVGQLLLAVVRPLWLRLLVALTFVAPAVIAGYHATHGIVKHTMPSETWQVIFSVIGAIAVVVTAFLRVTTTALAAPEPSRRGTARV